MKRDAEPVMRDIGEMTFGKRRRPDAGAAGFAAAAAIVDRRQRVDGNDILLSPWRKICDLLISSDSGTRHSGTGWFISPRTVVTAGHCLFIFNPGTVAHGAVREVVVMPGRNGESNPAHLPFGAVKARRDNFIVHPRWRSGDVDFDYGVIIIPEESREIGERVGHLKYGHFKDDVLNGSQPTLSGYPDDMAEGTQWFQVNTIQQLTQRSVSYNIFTAAGQSGSPVFFRNDVTEVACAIHNWGDDSLNRGVRINAEVVAQLDEWRVD